MTRCNRKRSTGLATAGNPLAQLALARHFSEGCGVIQDEHKALSCARRRLSRDTPTPFGDQLFRKVRAPKRSRWLQAAARGQSQRCCSVASSARASVVEFPFAPPGWTRSCPAGEAVISRRFRVHSCAALRCTSPRWLRSFVDRVSALYVFASADRVFAAARTNSASRVFSC